MLDLFIPRVEHVIKVEGHTTFPVNVEEVVFR